MLETADLVALVKTRMPFGRHAGKVLIDIPEDYLIWLAAKGLPEGRLGQLLVLALDVKTYELEYLFDPLRTPNDES